MDPRSPCRLTEKPAVLPSNLLSELARDGGLALLLDYDGTLAALTSDPEQAVPVPGVRRALVSLASHKSRISVSIITGRRILAVKRLLAINGDFFFSGVHGMEFAQGDGEPELIPEALASMPELDAIRGWLTRNVPEGKGFWIEDKKVAIGLHHRDAAADESRELCDRFARFVATQTPSLKIVQLKSIYEAMPRVAGKDRAVRRVLKRLQPSCQAVYMGDDLTDEDAFAVLRHGDVGVMVGAARPTRAQYHLPGPESVAIQLRALAAAVTATK